MKKIFLALLVLGMSSTAFAFVGDEAIVRVGGIKNNSRNGSDTDKSITAIQNGNNLVLTMLGEGKIKRSADITINLVGASNGDLLTKGAVFPVSIATNGSSLSSGAASVSFASERIRKTQTRQASVGSSTTARGKFYVLDYNPVTKQLSFRLKASAKNIDVTKIPTGSENGSTSTVSKRILLRARGNVTVE